MARNRFDNLEPERQEAILAAAAEEFAERGYSGASLNRVTEGAGISKGALYYYFDDKEDLFVTVVEVAVERTLADTGGLTPEELGPGDYWERVREYGLRSLELMSRDDWYIRLLLAFPRLRAEPEAHAAVRPALEWGRRYTKSILRRGQEVGVVRSDLPLDLLVEAAMAVDQAGDRWMLDHRDELGEEGLERLVAARIDLMRDMLDAENQGWE
jgi:AcrR family transcriptional regulator